MRELSNTTRDVSWCGVGNTSCKAMNDGITLKLIPEEEQIFEFMLYQFRGMQIAINQFVETNLEYNEDHYRRLVDTYIEKYKSVTDYIVSLLELRDYKDVAYQNFKYKYTKGYINIFL